MKHIYTPSRKLKAPSRIELEKYRKPRAWLHKLARRIFLAAFVAMFAMAWWLLIASQVHAELAPVVIHRAPKRASVKLQDPCSLKDVVCPQERASDPTGPATTTVGPSSTSQEQAEALIRQVSRNLGYDYPTYAVRLSRCESSLHDNAVGDGGTSFGLFQIHLPAHPSITKQQALDPLFATTWAITQLKAGRASLWTCSRII